METEKKKKKQWLSFFSQSFLFIYLFIFFAIFALKLAGLLNKCSVSHVSHL